ncbi:MAG: hypothetical protein ACP5E9_09675 [Candidatus Methanospirareceae archaeon]
MSSCLCGCLCGSAAQWSYQQYQNALYSSNYDTEWTSHDKNAGNDQKQGRMDNAVCSTHAIK